MYIHSRRRVTLGLHTSSSPLCWIFLFQSELVMSICDNEKDPLPPFAPSPPPPYLTHPNWAKQPGSFNDERCTKAWYIFLIPQCIVVRTYKCVKYFLGLFTVLCHKDCSSIVKIQIKTSKQLQYKPLQISSTKHHCKLLLCMECQGNSNKFYITCVFYIL